jgi:hypothetical protein
MYLALALVLAVFAIVLGNLWVLIASLVFVTLALL